MVHYIRFPQFSIYCTVLIGMNSNFPNDLSIFHSSYPSTCRPTLGSLDEETNNFLSAEAQDEAIAKYGIAGRVWYTSPFRRLLRSASADKTRCHATGKRLMP